MTDVRIREARVEDIDRIAANPRQADVDELWASGRSTPKSSMTAGLAGSTHCWTGLVDGEPVCMFGVTPVSILAGAGVPWLIGSAGMGRLKVQKALLKKSKPQLETMRRMYPTMINWVDDRNSQAIRWLRWCGFNVFDEAEPMGPDNVPFRRFEMRSDGHV